jgi:hypothetical protein
VSDNDSRNTPIEIVQMIELFDRIGLDSCSNATSVVGALQEYRLDRGENGLDPDRPWVGFGLVFWNGPWSDLMPWCDRAAREWRTGCMGGVESIGLTRTESATKWARLLGRTRTAHCQLSKRYCFPIVGQPDTTDTRPTTLHYFGERVHRFASVFREYGEVYGRPL